MLSKNPRVRWPSRIAVNVDYWFVGSSVWLLTPERDGALGKLYIVVWWLASATLAKLFNIT